MDSESDSNLPKWVASPAMYLAPDAGKEEEEEEEVVVSPSHIIDVTQVVM